jgi:hypothetical protein
MDNIFLAVLIAVAGWFALRWGRTARARRATRAGPPPVAEPDGSRPTMPRIGTPRTITRDQMRDLRKCDFEPSPQWSREEAQLILDAVAYLRCAIVITTGDREAPLEVQNKLLALILGEGELRDRVLDWSRNLTHEERRNMEAAVPRDAHFERVQSVVRKLWDDGART